MSKKQKTITCSYCGAENETCTTVCSKCGRIIQAKDKAPFDYRPIAALFLVLAIIAAIVGAIVFVKNNWIEYWYEFGYWYLNNETSAGVTFFIVIIIIATILVCKFSTAKTFGSLYVISCFFMLVLEFAIDCIDVSITGNPFSGIFDYIFGTLLFSLAPSVLVKIIRSASN